MAGYIRQDTTNNIADGNVINASDFDNEYNAIEAAFNATTGHTHDGTSAEGAAITKIGPTQDVVASASALTPKTDNTVDLGSVTLEYKDLFIDGTANIDSLVADTADINAGTIDGVTIGSASAGAGTFTALTTSSTVTLNGGTANGVLYLNGSKVATSGSALTFDGTTLLNSGVVRATSLSVVNSTSSVNQFANLQVDSAGLNISSSYVSSGDGTIRFSPIGSEQMRLTSTGLGIGTSSPAYRLQVQSAGTGTTAASNVVGRFQTNGSGYDVFVQLSDNVANSGGIGMVGGAMYLANGTTRNLTLDSSGNLGIGTSLPNQKLDVAGSVQIRDSGTHYLNNSDNSNQYYWQNIGASGANNATLILSRTNAGETLRVDSSGNLGLGVTPSASWTGGGVLQQGLGALYTNGALGAHDLTYNSVRTGSNTYVYAQSSLQATRFQQRDGAFNFFTAGTGTAGNAISFTQAMTLDASGNLLVGLTSGSQRLNVGGRISFGAVATDVDLYGLYVSSDTGNSTTLSTAGATAICFRSNNQERARITSGGDLLVGTTATNAALLQGVTSVINAGGSKVHVGHINGTITGESYAVFSYNGTAIGTITQNGTTAVAYNTFSDYRLKDNPQPLTNSGAFIDALQPKTWEWKADGARGVGFIAHEAQAVSPGSVVGEKDAVDAEGKPVMQAMEYGSAEFIANIIAELKSLRARVQALETP